MDADRPLTILICALGGEGGGVLAEWLVDTARASGHSVQSTSIPGVAQRTGATTYYVEIFPRPDSTLQGRRPVFSLTPVPGAIDVLVSTELLETARQTGNGYTHPERTLVISSSSRTLTTAEKMVMGDGRVDVELMRRVIGGHCAQLVELDMPALAQRAGTVISAVMFGAIAGSGRLPFATAACVDVIRHSGRGVEASVRGFDAAFEAMAAHRPMQAPPPAAAVPVASGSLDAAWLQAFAPSVREMVALGHARVREYQDGRYAALYLQRLQRVLLAERQGRGEGAVDFPTTRETARHLALWMAFDDIVRVAELKCRRSRFARVHAQVGASPLELMRVRDHFKPGVPELAALLPDALAGALLRWDRRRMASGRPAWALPIQLPSHTVWGLLMLRALAALKRLRPWGSRFAAEQAMIERWLGAVERGARLHGALGLELAECGRLIKGYGATNERGKHNLIHIVEQLAHAVPFESAQQRAQAIAAARRAALTDDAGKALDQALTQHGAAARPVPVQPVHWVRQRPGGRAGARPPDPSRNPAP